MTKRVVIFVIVLAFLLTLPSLSAASDETGGNELQLDEVVIVIDDTDDADEIASVTVPVESTDPEPVDLTKNDDPDSDSGTESASGTEDDSEQSEVPGLSGRNEFAEDPENDEIINVSIPLSLNFTIDPFEIRGRGSVYSDAHTIENLGTSDVLITFTDITVTFANDTDFLPLSRPSDNKMSESMKTIYLLLDFGRPDIQPVVATSPDTATPSVLLHAPGNELSRCALSISGEINPFPIIDWAAGDVKINIAYQLEAIGEEALGGGIVSDEEDPDDSDDPDEGDPDDAEEPEEDLLPDGSGESGGSDESGGSQNPELPPDADPALPPEDGAEGTEPGDDPEGDDAIPPDDDLNSDPAMPPEDDPEPGSDPGEGVDDDPTGGVDTGDDTAPQDDGAGAESEPGQEEEG